MKLRFPLIFLFLFWKSEILVEGQLLWDDASISEGPCTYPPAVTSLGVILTALNSLPQGFKLYVPFANKAYFRWQYHKAKNTPAETEEQVESLKPRLTFPNVLSVLNLCQGKIELFNPSTAWYELRCIPNNLFVTNATCQIPTANPGAAPTNFGFQSNGWVASTFIYADSSAWMEWHCFDGDNQIFNVGSINSTLTSAQISAMKSTLLSLGFNEDNFQFMTYP